MTRDAMTDDPRPDDGSLLVFRLDEEAFAIGVGAVHEILDAQVPTPVPNADAFAPGVINVRGVVVPVVDIRCRLGMGAAADPARARVIVVEVEIDGAAQKLAFAADAVEDVIEADLHAVERVPELGAVWPQAYLRGAVRRAGELVILLNAETLFHPRPAPRAAA
jgi:purine-binding chemotaxis protein CheW